MADVFSKKKRSQVMAAIRSTGNKDTELRLMSIFRRHGVTGWRRNQPLPGRPDFSFRPQRLAVFVDGCFWHGCRWHCRMPKTRTSFWTAKITRNKTRDQQVRSLLRKRGWRVLRLWEHSLKDDDAIAARVRAALSTRPRPPAAKLKQGGPKKLGLPIAAPSGNEWFAP